MHGEGGSQVPEKQNSGDFAESLLRAGGRNQTLKGLTFSKQSVFADCLDLQTGSALLSACGVY
jgi:hypothetical protein